MRELLRLIAGRRDVVLHVDAVARQLGWPALVVAVSVLNDFQRQHTLHAFASAAAAVDWLERRDAERRAA